MKCSCCGSEITCPVFIGQFAYGYTCAKMQNPGLSKPKKKTNFVQAESFTKTGDKIVAVYNGRKFAYWDIKTTTLSGLVVSVNGNAIYIQDGIAFIDLKMYMPS